MEADITRVWLTYLVMAAHRTGLAPISKQRLHRLVFLSNCLAPLFEATPNSAQIVKYKHGPFYPVVQWELDRLGAMGVVNVDNINYTHDVDGWWLDADYSVGPKTRNVVTYCNGLEYGQRLEQYLVEVTTAFASLQDDVLDGVALRDENYARIGATDDSFIDFSSEDQNLSVQTAREFRSVLPAGFAPSRKEELFLYLRFLEAVTQQAS
ncbi:hypothetical protein Ga0100231_021220 [Opitutaceae bacterium TAV4]|nr:hypothetical protein Ga0100231_021220 [Opitutaceae bacterium TAV4]RRJ99737.1 hypothetical protein Ga0100230_016840 [Opitutaceae bacterium TAV3]